MKFIYFLLFLVAFTRAQESSTDVTSSEAATSGSDAPDAGSTGSGSDQATTTTSKSSLLYPEFFVLGAAAYFARLF
ncbi:unnamed protein product [Hymenolepis diminuta]|uniref:Secreted protein n=1 Tax=Hymenolepis diminuta TaxID=6216 RepID=A0A0R3SLM3_HYMDI|nr:unnamed protein product [Hymenolepis diminuta]